MLSKPTTALALLAAASTAAAQTLGPLIRVNTPSLEFHYAETAIAVNPFDENELVALAMEVPADTPGGGHVYVASTRTGGPPFDLHQIAPTGPCVLGSSRDPFAAASPTTGQIWFGGMVHSASVFSGLFIARKDPGSVTYSDDTSINCHTSKQDPFVDFDKPWLVVGPRPGNTGESLFLGFCAHPTMTKCTDYQPLFGQLSAAIPPALVTSQWSSPSPIALSPGSCGEGGLGIGTIKILSGLYTGRIVATYGLRSTDVMGPPVVICSDDDGATWQEATGTTGTFTLGQPTNILGQAADGPIYPLPRPLPPTGTIVFNFPAIAVSPANPNTVFVAFTGCPNPHSPLTDLYIFRSTDAGATFTTTDSLHLTDALLGDAAGTYQVFPAITVDRFGGLNILYNRIYYPPTDPGTYAVDNRYVRITRFGESTQSIFTTTLAPAFDISAFARGDYQTIATSGCSVWPCFSSAHEVVNGSIRRMNYYIRRITLPECFTVADFNQNAEVEPTDIVAFGAAYLQGLPGADVNSDGRVNSDDWLTFINAYTARGGHP